MSRTARWSHSQYAPVAGFRLPPQYRQQFLLVMPSREVNQRQCCNGRVLQLSPSPTFASQVLLKSAARLGVAVCLTRRHIGCSVQVMPSLQWLTEVPDKIGSVAPTLPGDADSSSPPAASTEGADKSAAAVLATRGSKPDTTEEHCAGAPSVEDRSPTDARSTAEDLTAS